MEPTTLAFAGIAVPMANQPPVFNAPITQHFS